MLQLLISINESLKWINNNLERSDEKFIKVIEFKNIHNKDRKRNDAREANTLFSSIIFIKSSYQFDADAAEEENSDADC
jgi:hypothetical protein